MNDRDNWPVVVIGAGPVGLAAAAHLREHGIPVVVLEAGERVGAAMSEWGHIRTFTPWEYIVDAAAERLLEPTGWARPTGRQSPTGSEIVEQYLRPLADALGDALRTGARVIAVSRDGLDRSRTVGRAERPFLVRIERRDGPVEDLRARAVIDASGTWAQHNPLGSAGLPPLGEERARRAGLVVGPLPDVLGRDRERFAGRTTLVVGMGHSAANTLVALAQLAREVPGTRIVWAIRGSNARRVFGGGASDQLADRGRLGSDLEDLVGSGALELVTGFSTRELHVAQDSKSVAVIGDTPEGERVIDGIHQVVAATGFRPDLTVTAELQLDLHPGLEAPRALGPLVDPAFHSCGTVPPHGWRELAHDNEPDFYVVGMKSYGRAPTFLITTGNEQVRSIAAHLAGDDAAADEVRLVLPETGVCSSSNALSDEELAAGAATGSGCCGPSDGAVARKPQSVTLERIALGPDQRADHLARVVAPATPPAS
ncbi:flavoprotein [Intrasporangium oryzae NRRL B-24470]|uniref:Flavoprotein n=1 Tax=Intrasporangium oryzae NRRL B-24470 TaxID=1386089 RepID=W9G943_9MICO|nr:NAD(P)-binding domain-containing protein [Intrasporangium oryzae]EWT02540.1 flavoprotein [Intrasporangium oryzae NRRL B-24470]